MKLEQEYQGILQNIESTVIRECNAQTIRKDATVLAAYKALANAFGREKRKLPKLEFMLTPKAKILAEQVHLIASMYVHGGEIPYTTEDGKIEHLIIEPEVNAGLMEKLFKRLVSSVRFWSKRDGSSGYINFVGKHV